MHRCLCVDEIVRLISHELVMAGGKATAVALACCCKRFEDPALDSLWETQSDFISLLDTFPGDVWGHVYEVSMAIKISLLSIINHST